MQTPIERFSVDHLPARGAAIQVLRQELCQVDVHWHDFYELVFVANGAARHVLNGVVHSVRRGSVFLLTPADFHELAATSEQPLLCYNVVINAHAAEMELAELLPPGVSWSATAIGEIVELEADFLRLWKESRLDQLGSSAMMMAVVRCILIEVARRAGSPYSLASAEPSPLMGEMRRAIWYVDRHFREPLTLAEVAAQACLSPNYFSERFRQSTGTSFQAYLLARRLRFARSLLASTVLGVTEVCHAAGFNSPSHFGRAYRRRYGHAPSGSRLIRR